MAEGASQAKRHCKLLNFLAYTHLGVRDHVTHCTQYAQKWRTGMTPAAIARYARRWQPMRSYALLHIWYTDDWAPAAE